MGKKSSNQPQETTSTVYQNTIPEWARPYAERILTDAEAQSNEPYVPYGGARIQGFDPTQQQAFGGYESLFNQGNPTLDGGIASINQSNQTLGGLSDYNAQNVGTDNWNNQIAAQYMNPFVSQVLNQQNQQAYQRFNEEQGMRNTAANRSGAFGGSRQGIVDQMAMRDMDSQLNSNAATAYRDAYQSGLGAYQNDASRQLQAMMANQTTGLNAADLNQRGLLAKSGQYAQNAGTMGQLGSTQQALAMERLKGLSDVGQQKQDLGQRSLDQAYQDFVNQRDYGRQNLSFMSGILHGIPVNAQSDVIQYQAAPNSMSQALGLGIAGLGVSGLGGSG